MTQFCNAHIGQRTRGELVARYTQLQQRRDLTPGLAAEKARITTRLAQLGVALDTLSPLPDLFHDF